MLNAPVYGALDLLVLLLRALSGLIVLILFYILVTTGRQTLLEKTS